jgi:NAD(P)-dependent dehydrogenase (short-subunit alcohol dehydrogenase family)
MNSKYDFMRLLTSNRLSRTALSVLGNMEAKTVHQKNDVVVVIGVGGIGMAIARRQGAGKTLLLADVNGQVLNPAATVLREASYDVETLEVDVSSRASVVALAKRAADLGHVMQVINTAGLSPNMASPRRALEVDLYGTAVVFEEFEQVIAPRGAGLVISSMAGHMMPSLPPKHDQALAFTPADDLLALDCLNADAIPNPMVAYIMAKRANALRVQAAAMSWGAKGARVNAISPGIIATPLAQRELASDIGDGYRAMIDASPAGRMAPPEEVAAAAAYLLGQEAGFITGTDLLIDGGVIAAMLAGKLPVPA